MTKNREIVREIPKDSGNYYKYVMIYVGPCTEGGDLLDERRKRKDGKEEG